MDKLKKEFASKLLKVKAIKLQPNDPFTWASGWKSPFYCDNRKTLSFPELRNYVKLELVHAILEQNRSRWQAGACRSERQGRHLGWQNDIGYCEK